MKMAYNPNAVFISHSSLGDFEKCPQRYYYLDVYRSPRGLKLQIINPSLALGQTVHDVLNQFLNLPPQQRNHEELQRIFDFLWGTVSGEKGGFQTKDEEETFHQRAVEMLARFEKNRHFQETEPVKISGFPKTDLGNDLFLTGKVDWIEKDGENYHVIDFKTGKNEEKEDSLQLPIYAILVSDYFKTKSIRTSYWYLDKDEEIVSFNLPDLEKMVKSLRQRGEIIKVIRQTNSYRCQSGGESCWACRDILAVVQGKGKLVSIDMNRKQEIYILPKTDQNTPPPEEQPFETPNDLPF